MKYDSETHLVAGYLDAKEYVTQAGYGAELDWQQQRDVLSVDERDFLRELAWVVLSCTENCRAVREATAGGGAGTGASVASTASLSRGEAVADGVRPASGAGESPGCRGDCGADGRRGALSAVSVSLNVITPQGLEPLQFPTKFRSPSEDVQARFEDLRESL